jgi:hypothetical protein
MAKIFEKLIFGGLHKKHAVQRGIFSGFFSDYTMLISYCFMYLNK